MTVTNTVPPAISGTARSGQTLVTTNGSWTYDLDFLEYAYRWLRCDAAGANCVEIAGETNISLLLTGADVGSRIRSEVTATETAFPPPSGDALTWTPPGYPSYTGYTTITVPTTGAVPAPYGSAGQPWVINLVAGQDYILDIGLRRNPAWGGFSINGGRNIVIMGGEFEILDMRGQTDQGVAPDYSSRREVLKFSGQTGIVHVEGVWMHGDGTVYGGPLRPFVFASNIVFQIQNIRIDDLLMWEENFNTAHSDVTLEQNGLYPSELRIDKLTSNWDNTGFAFYENGGRRIIKRVNLIATGIDQFGNPRSSPLAGNYLHRNVSGVRVDISDFYVTTGKGRLTAGPWPQPGATHWDLQGGWTGVRGTTTNSGTLTSPPSSIEFTNSAGDNVFGYGGGNGIVRYGPPPGGDFVPLGVAGQGYVSPGYL